MVSRGRGQLLASAVAAAAGLAAMDAFVNSFGTGPRAVARGRDAGAATLRVMDVDVGSTGAGGLADFQGSQASLWTSFVIILLCIPGVASQIQRAGQAKYVEKTYVMAGPGEGGLEMRSIAGGVVAYFSSQNYTMEEAPQKGKVRFVGNLQGSMSQALNLTFVLFGALFSGGIALNAMFPQGPFGLNPNLWFLPLLASPGAGWYYWQRAFRRDIVELQMEMSDDSNTTTLTALGNETTIEGLQTGVRFQSPDGKLLQLMERGMEYQEGLLEVAFGGGEKMVVKDQEKAAAEKATA